MIRPYKKYSTNELAFIEKHYPTKDNAWIGEKLNRTVMQITSTAKRYGFKKGYCCRFKSGHTPANKGKKMPRELREKVKHTFFQTGHIPKTYRPVGSERINVDGYIEIKIADPNKWDQKHRVVWRQHNGEIPHLFNVQFKDNNRLNCNIDNLYLISRQKQMIQNSIIRYPPELRTSLRSLRKLNNLITKKIKKHETN